MPERDRPTEATTSSSNADPYPVSAGVRAFLGNYGIGSMGVGLDAAYSLSRSFAVGALYTHFVADRGADPHYCGPCARGGGFALIFAEGRYWPEGWATPYARLGAGIAHLHGQRVPMVEGYTEIDPAVGAEAGLDLHYRFASLRLFGFADVAAGSKLEKTPFMGAGTQLGARF